MLGKFLKAGSWVLLANFAVKGINLFLLPLYTRFLTPADYGILDLLTSLESLLSGVLMAGMDTALMVFVGEARDSHERASIAKTVFLTNMALGASALALIACAPLLSTALFASSRYRYVVMISLIRVAFLVWTGSQVAWLRIEMRFSAYALIQVMVSAVQVALGILFVMFLHMGYMGLVIANLVSAFGIYGVNLGFVRRCWTSGRFTPSLVKELLRFGLPLAPGAISGWVLAFSDRIIIAKYIGGADVGLYGMASRFSAPIAILVAVFQGVFPSFVYNKADREAHKAGYLRIFDLYVGAFGVVAVVYSLWAPFLMRRILPASYSGASYPVFFVIASAFFQGACYLTGAGMSLAKKTNISIAISWLAACLNAGLNLAWVPRMGIAGAASATLISTATIFFVQWIFSERHFPFHPDRKRLVFQMFILLCIGFVGHSILGMPIFYGRRAVVVDALLSVVAIGLSAAWNRKEYGSGLRLARAWLAREFGPSTAGASHL